MAQTEYTLDEIREKAGYFGEFIDVPVGRIEHVYAHCEA